MVGTNIVDPTTLIVNFLPPFGWLLVICLGQTLLDLRQLPSPKNFEVFSRRNSNDLSWFEMSDNLKSTGWAKSRGQTAQCFELKHWTLSTVYRLSLRLTSLVFFRYPSHGTNESHTRMTTPTDYYNTTPVDGIENTHHLTAIYPLLFLLLEWGAEMLSLSFVSSQNAVMKTKKSTTNTLVIDLYALAFLSNVW